MNKYQIGQIVYWVRFNLNIPYMTSFEVGSIKQDKMGYKYSDGHPGSSYVAETDIFLSKDEAVEYRCERIRRLLSE